MNTLEKQRWTDHFIKKKIPVWSTCEPMSHKPASVYNSFQVAVEKAAVYILPAELVMFKQH